VAGLQRGPFKRNRKARQVFDFEYDLVRNLQFSDMLLAGPDPGALDDCPPSRNLGLDDGRKFRRRIADGVEPEDVRVPPHLGQRQDAHGLALDLANDRGRRVGRREQAEPRHRLESHSGIPPWSESRVPTCAADFAVVEAERRGEELP
jgi:hypothetical protein